jgi:hypothetical protein
MFEKMKTIMRTAIIIIILSILTGCADMKKTFVKERKELLDRSLSSEIKVFSEETTAHLPE